MVLIMQDLAIETPRPRYMDALLNWIRGILTGWPLALVRQLRW